MVLEHADIVRMYAEIENYSGDFGDGVIGEVPSHPLDHLQMSTLSLDERNALVAAVLRHLCTAIDNSSYEGVLTSEQSRNVHNALHDGLFDDNPTMKSAFIAFFQSEASFYAQLRDVYCDIVLPELRRLRREK